MEINQLLTALLPRIHIISGIILFIILLIKFPKKVKTMDPNWLNNNWRRILLTSFGIGGFISICIGLLFLLINGNWPSDYIPANTISTSLIITLIYLVTLIYQDIKSYKSEIELRYGIVKPKTQPK